MGQVSRFLMLGSCLLVLNGSALSAQQVVSNPGPTPITTGAGSGQNDGISFTASPSPGADSTSVLTIPGGVNINANAHPIGVTTFGGGIGSLDFTGTSGTSVVNGTIGDPTLILLNITGGNGSSQITFNGNVFATTFDVSGSGTVQFNGNTTTALNFDALADGTVNIAAGKNLTGAVTIATSTNIGTLILNNGSSVTGAIASPTNTLKQLTITGNAAITGQVVAENITLGANTLALTGALFVPGGSGLGVINTTILSDTVFGNIATNNCAEASTVGTPLTINASVQGQLTGAPLTLICGSGGSSGSIVNVISDNPQYSFTAVNTSGMVQLFPQYHFIPPSNPAAAGPAAVLSSLFTTAGANPSSDLAVVMNAITALPPGAAQEEALLQLNPIVDGALTQLSFASTQLFQDLWMRQMGNGRCIMATQCGDVCPINRTRTPAEQASCELRGQKGCYSETNCANVANKYEVWADGFGYWGHQDARQGFDGYNAQIYGGMLGLQAPLNQITSLGVAAGYANTQISRHNHSSIQTWDGTAYLSLNPTHWYLDAAFSFDYNFYKDQRHIQFTGIDRTADASYDGQQYTGLLAGGYRYYTDSCLVITPLASLQYSYLHVNHYHENGAGDIDLYVNSQGYDFLESGLGLKLAGPIQTGWGAFVPEVHALWYYDYFGDPMELNTSFSGVARQGGTIETDGPGNDKNWGDLGVGLTYYSCSELSVEFVYNYEFSKTYNAQEGLVKITQRF